MSEPEEPTDAEAGTSDVDAEAETSAAATATGREIWIEKYRPQTLADIHGHEDIVERLESYIEQDDLPHLLFSGPAGVGKCVTGDTPVLTGSGVRRIEDVVGDVEGFAAPGSDLMVATLTAENDLEYVSPSDVFAKDADELVTIRTRDGGEFRVTPEHKLRVITEEGFEWVEAASLSADDRIARPRSVPAPDPTAPPEPSTADTSTPADSPTSNGSPSSPSSSSSPTPAPSLRWFDSMDPDRTEVRLSADALGDHAATIGTEIDEPVPLSRLHESDLEPGQWIPGVEEIEYVAANGRRARPITPPTTMTPILARFVGLAISEASIDNGQIKFYNTDEGLLDAFEAAAKAVFDVETVRGRQHDVPFVRLGSKTLTHYLESTVDVFASAAGGSGIGSAIVSADRDSRAAFLRAVFDAEAHVDTGGTIELIQRNPDHITLVSYLLATFGIPSRRATMEKAATNGTGIERTYHAIYVSGSRVLQRFESTIGFSIDEKADRLADHAEKTSNPNHDTMPRQAVLRKLCDRLDLRVTDHLPRSLDPDTPGRERYCAALNDVIDAATERIENCQRALERLDRMEPLLDATTSLPAAWVESRGALAPIETRTEIAESTGVRSDRLLECSDGRRTPYSSRALSMLEELDRPIEVTADQPIEIGADQPGGSTADRLDGTMLQTVKLELRTCRDLIGATDVEITEGLEFGPSDLRNLLEADGHAVRVVTRFETVANRLREVALDRLTLETIELLEEAARIANADLYYDRVESVERTDADERVYDLTVPGTRNYVAGNVPTVMHNTTSATAIAREIYGDDWRGNFLELNASDQRGIDVVRDRIKNFARSSFGGYEHRIIFLDEADSLTSDAQSALRRTMEQFSDNTRFILSCNYSSKIIDPIQSRCAVFRFSPLSDEAIASQVREIAAAEGIEVTEAGVDALVYAANGDMRRAINSLQAAATTGEVVDEQAVYAITATARPEEIESMVTDALSGDFSRARATLDTLLTETGMAGGDVIDQLHRSVWEFDLSEREAVRLMERIGQADYRITEGANEQVQLEALLAALSLPEEDDGTATAGEREPKPERRDGHDEGA
ncbi:replication factor C small subunit [Halopenitus persicus]|uniref:replication factor C small subunit n=1 Tax=Halopenitus persicus TaxID=1048396 RepID=UPI001E4FEADC